MRQLDTLVTILVNQNLIAGVVIEHIGFAAKAGGDGTSRFSAWDAVATEQTNRVGTIS